MDPPPPPPPPFLPPQVITAGHVTAQQRQRACLLFSIDATYHHHHEAEASAAPPSMKGNYASATLPRNLDMNANINDVPIRGHEEQISTGQRGREAALASMGRMMQLHAMMEQNIEDENGLEDEDNDEDEDDQQQAMDEQKLVMGSGGGGSRTSMISGSRRRRKIPIRRIENNISRQTTFSKRRNGLMKKAHELSVLCDAEVALIVFSSPAPSGKLFEFASSGSMERTLQRYRKFSSSTSSQDVNGIDAAQETDIEYWKFEVGQLQERLRVLEGETRKLAGEDVESLPLRELQKLENQLQYGIKKVRSKKTRLMVEEIQELRRKEKLLQRENEALKSKISTSSPLNQVENINPSFSIGEDIQEASFSENVQDMSSIDNTEVASLQLETTRHQMNANLELVDLFC